MKARSIGGSQVRLVVLVMLIAVAVGIMMAAAPEQLNAQGGPTLLIRAPKKVDVGEPIELQLEVHNAGDIAGYELNVLFDPGAAHFSGLHQRNNDLKKLGRDVIPLQVEPTSGGVAIGLATCAQSDCVNARGNRREQGAGGNFRLGTLILGTDTAGPLEIRFDAPKFVDAAGNPIAVGLSAPSLTVQVGKDGSAHPAPGGKWQLSSTQSNPPDRAALDVTHDRKISHADVMELAIAWSDARVVDSPCGNLPDPALDVNGDGCIDVVDVQLVANSAQDSAAAPEAATAPLTFTVNTTNDAADYNPGNGVCEGTGGCTLRAAIDEANLHSGPDTIQFNIGGGGVKTIQLKTSLSTLSDTSGPTTIDGYTQPGSAVNTSGTISNAKLMIQISGGGDGGYDMFRISSPGNVIKGLAVYNARRKFYIYGSGAHDNVFTGNFVGTNAAATYQASAYYDISSGFYVAAGAARNRIGGTTAAERNVISGNARHGVETHNEGSNGNLVYGNIIGLSPDGTRRLQNYKHGVDINSGSSGNLIGGTGAGQRNVISGNGLAQLSDYTAGVEISHDTLTQQNQVVGNFIGTDVTGNAAPDYTHNSHYGVRLEDGVNHNTVSNNVIVNSKQGGVKLDNYYTENNQISNNRIGVGINGAVLPNLDFGIQDKYHASHNTIGPGNIIANNPTGVIIEYLADDYNTITRNSIYNNTNMGIDLGPTFGVTSNDSGDSDTGANQGLNYPVITRATTVQVTGKACAESAVPKPCTIEVFIAQPLSSDKSQGKVGQGKTFVGSGTTDSSGNFAVAVSGVSSGNQLTATATDAQGNTSEFAYNITVGVAPVGAKEVPTEEPVAVSGQPPASTPEPPVASGQPPAPTPEPPAPTTEPQTTQVIVSDSFGRTVKNKWGRAETGGTYELEGPQANFDVDGQTGTLRLKDPGKAQAALLAKASAQNIEFTVRVSMPKLPQGGTAYAYLLARQVDAGNAYLARLRFAPDGSVFLQPIARVNGTDRELAPEQRVANTADSATGFVWLKGRVVRSSPTTIQLKAWADGQPEPKEWLSVVEDDSPELQQAGNIGLGAASGKNVKNSPLPVMFDDLEVSSNR